MRTLTVDAARFLEAELAALEEARPSSIPAFATARVMRIADIKKTLATTCILPPRDRALEQALKNSQGGDRFGR